VHRSGRSQLTNPDQARLHMRYFAEYRFGVSPATTNALVAAKKRELVDDGGGPPNESG